VVIYVSGPADLASTTPDFLIESRTEATEETFVHTGITLELDDIIAKNGSRNKSNWFKVHKTLAPRTTRPELGRPEPRCQYGLHSSPID
jgi:hypothetical protein